MAKLVLDQSQIILDDFFQSFRPANAFFDIDDIALRVIDTRDQLLEQEFLVQWQQNKTTFPLVNPEWTKNVVETIEYEKDTNRAFVKICEPLFEFPMDTVGMGIQSVVPLGKGCAEFVRIANNQVWSLCLTASTEMNFFSVQGCELTLHNFNACAEKLQIRIVPSEGGLPMEQQTVPDGKAAQIREIVLNKLWRDYQARLGRISTQGENGNPNPMPNETGQIFEGLKTK